MSQDQTPRIKWTPGLIAAALRSPAVQMAQQDRIDKMNERTAEQSANDKAMRDERDRVVASMQPRSK